MARLLTVVAGGRRFALPLEYVVGVQAGGQSTPPPAAVSLAAALALPPGNSATLVQVRAGHGVGWLAVDAAGGTLEVPCHPLPPLPGPGGRPLPFIALATPPGEPALVVDPSAVLAAPSGPAPDPVPEAVNSASGELHPAAGAAVWEGQSLLVCSAGPFSLRGRPLAVGLPLRAVTQVRSAAGLVPLPLAAPPLAGVLVVDGRAVPALSAAALAGLAQQGAGARQAVLLRTPGGPLALLVDAALATETPAHWAPAALLRPLSSPVLLGAVAHRTRWTAVLDPSLSLSALPAPPVPSGAVVTFPERKETPDNLCQTAPRLLSSFSSSASPS